MTRRRFYNQDSCKWTIRCRRTINFIIAKRYRNYCQGLSHWRQQRQACEMGTEIVDHELTDRSSCLQCGAAMMRLHDDAGQRQYLGAGEALRKH